MDEINVDFLVMAATLLEIVPARDVLPRPPRIEEARRIRSGH